VYVDITSPQPGELTLDLPSTQAAAIEPAQIHTALLEDLWRTADCDTVGLTKSELAACLITIGTKYNFGLPSEIKATTAQIDKFYLTLQLPELALAQACALGRDQAWQLFLTRYRTPLKHAAIAITGSSSLGEDLADSLYSELFGLTERDGQRRSPLASYSGRGFLVGWLRTTLAQRHVDHHRHTHRESPLEDIDPAAANSPPITSPDTLRKLSDAVTNTLQTLTPDDRFLLVAYFLDQHTLLQIAHLLRVHEATISRRLKRLTTNVSKQILKHLQNSGLSKRAAEEALGTDPRDLTINLRNVLQPSSPPTFLHQATTPDPKQS
jgi:RNA polymerase sigma-70 factor, ECF subfamily